jgi:hypothetical protein
MLAVSEVVILFFAPYAAVLFRGGAELPDHFQLAPSLLPQATLFALVTF